MATLSPWPGLRTALAQAPGQAQETRFFRVGGGPVDSSYFAVGTLIGNVVSSPPGARDCDRGGSCGVPGLIAVTQTTPGPVANVELIAAQRLDSALCQADIAYWGVHGTGMFRRQGPATNLRAIASLYPETMHIVTRADRKIDEFRKLRGRTVSLGEPNSSTFLSARAMLQTLGIGAREINAVKLAPTEAAQALQEGKIDAFFHIAGVPSPIVRKLSGTGEIALLPISGMTARRLRGAFPFFSESVIPDQTYQGVGETPSLSVCVLWVTGAEVDEKIVYGLTRALFHPNNRKALDSGNPFGRFIRLETALEGVAMPVHSGAALYYFEAGLIH